MDRRTMLMGGGAALVVGGAVYSQLSGGEPSQLLVGMANAQEATGDPSTITDMVLGDADAPIEMIEYASYTCPHCAAFHANVYPQLKADYIETGKVKFIYREVYFDRFGLWASMIARCSGDSTRFFGMSELIYEKQREWTASGDPSQIIEELRKLGKLVGLTDAMLDECMQDGAQAQSLVTWFEENAARDGVNSTPTFLIDGTKYANMSYPDMSALLDAKLEG